MRRWREFSLYQDPNHVADLFAAHRTPGIQADVQIGTSTVSRFMGQPMTFPKVGPQGRMAWMGSSSCRHQYDYTINVG
jgi:hypothetical protein